MVNSVDANVTTEPISTSSNVIVSSLIVATSIMAHREYDDKNAFDYGSVDCEDDFMECETFGMYAMN